MQLFGAIKFTYINGGPHILCLCLLDEGGNEIRARILNKIKKNAELQKLHAQKHNKIIL